MRSDGDSVNFFYLILCTNGHNSRCYVQDLVGISKKNPIISASREAWLNLELHFIIAYSGNKCKADLHRL